MRQRCLRALPWMLLMGMGVGIAACTGVPRGPASSVDPAIFDHRAGMAAVGDGDAAAVRPFPRLHASDALEERLPGGTRLTSADSVAAADAPMSMPPLEEDEVIEEYDPWEPFNRRMFTFNRQLDRWVLKPVATAWDTVLPDLAQDSLGNFFDNLGMPARLVNNLFQRNVEGAGREFGRFFLNLSMGVLGFFDAATELGLAKSEADAGQTLGVYGAGPGPYLVLPLLPPLTVRDGMGFAVDTAMNPLSYVAPTAANLGRRGVNTVNERSLNLDTFEEFEETTFDLYTAVRNAYLQRRHRAIQERISQSQAALSAEPGGQAVGASDVR